MNYDRSDLLDRLASEYVLGTLRGGARRRFATLLTILPSARAAVEQWEHQLALLASSLPPVEPPPRAWAAIQSRIGSRLVARAVPRSWWSALWKPAVGFAFGAVLTFALVRLMPEAFVSLDGLAQREQALPQSYVGLLLDGEDAPALVVSSTRHGKRVTVKFLRPITVPAGKVIQVWALPREGAAFALGVASATKPPGSTSFGMTSSSETLLSKVARLAVSFEDAPAQPGTVPQPFIASGPCVKLW